jgi:hypothetical protein
MRGTSIHQTVKTLAAATSTQLVASNPSRTFLALQNIGAGDATLAFNAAAVAGSGWLLATAGSGGFSWDGLTVPTDEVRAISTPGTTIIVWEG